VGRCFQNEDRRRVAIDGDPRESRFYGPRRLGDWFVSSPPATCRADVPRCILDGPVGGGVCRHGLPFFFFQPPCAARTSQLFPILTPTTIRVSQGSGDTNRFKFKAVSAGRLVPACRYGLLKTPINGRPGQINVAFLRGFDMLAGCPSDKILRILTTGLFCAKAWMPEAATSNRGPRSRAKIFN